MAGRHCRSKKNVWARAHHSNRGDSGPGHRGRGEAMNIIVMLIVWRFIVGVGIGGDYPLSATISSEFASTKIRGRMMTAVFAAQGWGNFAASLVATIITIAYKNVLAEEFPADSCTSCNLAANQICYPTSKLTQSFNRVDQMWRLLIGMGCIPAVLALYFRLTIPETPRFTLDIERNILRAENDIRGALTPDRLARSWDELFLRADAPRPTRRDFRRYFGQWKNLRVLIGTAYSWLHFTPLGLNASVILAGIGFGDSSDVYKNIYHLCVGNLILAVAGLIPGYWACFLFIDTWGRRPIQLMGFCVLTGLFLVMGLSFNHFIQYDAATTANFGPNSTTFIIPGEIFPTRYRSTGHGISAATGKLGAILAQVMFTWLVDTADNKWLDHSFEILAGFMFTGVLSTLLVPETKGKSLEELSGEGQEEFMQPAEIPMDDF
ncbi:Inorganic phosphate transporter PHO84 [Mycena sanguinolenta]|uniref:Inorganic phosphate transporter PHO84 n=1 Tax=Mycena sanguinolenta TaxID=230812 RepID=A0A8H7D3P1_9AGAR|nr:Inorganic phosphate transporter PHO84 [Mycena sanguinolenta]